MNWIYVSFATRNPQSDIQAILQDFQEIYALTRSLPMFFFVSWSSLEMLSVHLPGP